MRALAVAAVFASLLCASADALPAIVTFLPRVQPVTVTLENADQVQTIALNGILYRQPLAHSDLVRLSAPLTIVLGGSRRHDLTPDNLMFATGRVRGVFAMSPSLNTQSEGGPAVSYCTYDVTFTGHNIIGVSMAGHTCLIDEDADGQFDIAYAAGGSDGLAGYLIGGSGTRVPAGVTYVRAQAQNAQIGDLALRFAHPLLFEPRLQLELLSDHSTRVIQERSFPIPSSLPAIMSIHGAEIEILSMENQSLTYRVKVGFDFITSELRFVPENGYCISSGANTCQ